MSHTKGDWRATLINTIVAKSGKVIATLTKGGRPQKELTANAHLIAAAPDLLAALEEIKIVILKLSDDADTERFSRKIQDYDEGYSEGKYRGIEKAEAEIGKILMPAIAKAKKGLI